MTSKWHRLIGFILFLSLSDMAYAQQNCEWRAEGPLGPAWYQPGGWGACNNDTQQPASPKPRWASRWGAVAIDNRTGDAGTITNQSSAHDANRIALQRCGSRGCEIQLTYHNQCAAIAWGTKVYNASTAATIEEASNRALLLCGKDANDCKIVYSECSLAERIQ